MGYRMSQYKAPVPAASDIREAFANPATENPEVLVPKHPDDDLPGGHQFADGPKQMDYPAFAGAQNADDVSKK